MQSLLLLDLAICPLATRAICRDRRVCAYTAPSGPISWSPPHAPRLEHWQKRVVNEYVGCTDRLNAIRIAYRSLTDRRDACSRFHTKSAAIRAA